MLNLESITVCLSSILSSTKVHILFEILQSFLCISFGGGVRTLSRYTEKSERSIFRFISAKIAWKEIFIRIFKQFLYIKGSVYLLAADETVEGKSRKKTYGVNHFYSSILQKAIRSVSLFGFTLIEVSQGVSYFMGFEQVVYTEQDKERIDSSKAKKAAGKGKSKGRKKGSVNRRKETKAEDETASFRTFKTFFVEIIGLLSSIIPDLRIAYLVVDSA